jgi:hypothetical protein
MEQTLYHVNRFGEAYSVWEDTKSEKIALSLRESALITKCLFW